MEIKIKRIHKDAKLPEYQSKGASGMDLRILEDLILKPGETTLAPTGLSLSIPMGYEGQIRSRSSVAASGVVVVNAPGTIDSDYRGEVRILLRNLTLDYAHLKANMRVAQLVVCPVESVTWEETDELLETDRGSGGFGSTGND